MDAGNWIAMAGVSVALIASLGEEIVRRRARAERLAMTERQERLEDEQRELAARLGRIEEHRHYLELAPRFSAVYLGELEYEPGIHLVDVENLGPVDQERVHIAVPGWGSRLIEALAVAERIAEPREQDRTVDAPGDTPCNSLSLGAFEAGERVTLRVIEGDDHGGGDLRLRVTTIRHDPDREWNVTIDTGHRLSRRSRRQVT